MSNPIYKNDERVTIDTVHGTTATAFLSRVPVIRGPNEILELYRVLFEKVPVGYLRQFGSPTSNSSGTDVQWEPVVNDGYVGLISLGSYSEFDEAVEALFAYNRITGEGPKVRS